MFVVPRRPPTKLPRRTFRNCFSTRSTTRSAFPSGASFLITPYNVVDNGQSVSIPSSSSARNDVAFFPQLHQNSRDPVLSYSACETRGVGIEGCVLLYSEYHTPIQSYSAVPIIIIPPRSRSLYSGITSSEPFMLPAPIIIFRVHGSLLDQDPCAFAPHTCFRPPASRLSRPDPVHRIRQFLSAP